MSASRFKLKVSRRTAGLTITGLLMIAAIGYVGYTTSTPAQVDLEPSVTTTAPETNSDASNGAAPTTTGTGGPVVTMPDRPVEVTQIPFLTTETPQPEETEATTPRVNPAVATDDLPNPFRPLRVAQVPSTTATATTTTTATTSSTSSVPTVPAAPSAPPVVVARPAIVSPGSGVLPIPTIPNTPAATSASTTGQITNVAGGSLPPVTIRPGGTVAVRPPNITGATPFPRTPTATPPTVVGQPTTNPTVPAAPIVVPPTTSATALPTPPARPPVRVPVPTLNAPTVTALPSASTEATEEQATSSVNPEVPAVIAELAAPDAPAAPVETTSTTPAQAAPTPLDTYVTEQGLSYNAVVLGPVNTGIFQTKTGYVVVSIGEKLPDSDIVLKDVSATTVTLTLGDQQKTLELDKR